MSAVTVAELRRLRAAVVHARNQPALLVAAGQLADALTKAPRLVILGARIRDLGRYGEADQVLLREAVCDAFRRRDRAQKAAATLDHRSCPCSDNLRAHLAGAGDCKRPPDPTTPRVRRTGGVR